MPAWRLIETAPAPGAVNMAVDQVLVERVQAGGAPVLRLYRWTPACLSLGRNQSTPGPALARAAAPGEVVVGGRKLVGSAQRRDGRVLLQHGSLLLDGSQDLAAELVGWEDAQATSAITLAEVLDPLPDWSAIVEAIAAGFADVLGTALAPDALSPAEHERTTTLRAHFESDEWMWRR